MNALGGTAAEASSRPGVMCVDDEPLVLEGLRDVLRRSFDVHTVTDGHAALEILRGGECEVAVLIADMRMPLMDGAQFLGAARLIVPDAVPILLTGHADLDAAVSAVNRARLFRFLTKPCAADDMLRACAAALGEHSMRRTERGLARDTLRCGLDALIETLALVCPAAFARGQRVKQLAADFARAGQLDDCHELEAAAMLAQLGAITLPAAAAEKLYAGLPLTPPEAALADRMPIVTTRLIGKIGGLEGILEILLTSQTPPDRTEADQPPQSAPPAGRMLRIVADYAEMESQHTPPDIALGAMRTREIYDHELLDAFAEMLGVVTTSTVREIPITELRVGMQLAANVLNPQDGLLVTSGQEITQRLIELLTNLGEGGVRQPIRVYGPGDDA